MENETRGRHLIVQRWLAGETDAGGCISELEQALIRADVENTRLSIRCEEFDAVLVELDGLSDNELFPGFVRQACRAFGKVSKYEEFIETLRAIPSHPNIIAMLEQFKIDQLGITAKDIAETNFRIEDKER